MSNSKLTFSGISLSLLCFFCIVPVIWWLLPLHYANENVEAFCGKLFLGGCFFSLLCSLPRILREAEESAGTLGVISTIGGILFVVPVLVFIIGFGGMCAYSTLDTLYFRDNGDKIIVRGYGCGATDSEFQTISVAKVSSFTPWFTYTQNVDTTKIDKTKWHRAIPGKLKM